MTWNSFCSFRTGLSIAAEDGFCIMDLFTLWEKPSGLTWGGWGVAGRANVPPIYLYCTYE
jgi:hypothetical protein